MTATKVVELVASFALRKISRRCRLRGGTAGLGAVARGLAACAVLAVLPAAVRAQLVINEVFYNHFVCR